MTATPNPNEARPYGFARILRAGGAGASAVGIVFLIVHILGAKTWTGAASLLAECPGLFALTSLGAHLYITVRTARARRGGALPVVADDVPTITGGVVKAPRLQKETATQPWRAAWLPKARRPAEREVTDEDLARLLDLDI